MSSADNAPTSPKRSKAKDWAINIGLMLGAIAVYLLVAEFVLRAGDDGADPYNSGGGDGPYAGIYVKSSDPELQYELKPGGGEVVNDLGYIGPEVDTAKPQDTLRVVGLGDSITMYETYEGHNYLTVFGKSLRPAGKARVEMLNFAVGGYDTAQEVRTLETKGLQYGPDIVVVGYCLNDGFDDYFIFNEVTGRIATGAADRAEIDAVKGMSSDGEERGLAIVSFLEKKLEAASADLTPDAFYQVVFASKAWKASMKGLERLGAIKRERDIAVVVVIFPFLVDFDDYMFGRMHARVAEQARAAGLDVVDLFEPFKAVGWQVLRNPDAGDDSKPGVDYVHPNPKGHGIAAQALLKWAKERGFGR